MAAIFSISSEGRMATGNSLRTIPTRSVRGASELMARFICSRGRMLPWGNCCALRTPPQHSHRPSLVTPESDVAIEDFTPTSDRLFVVDMAGGPSQIRIFTTDGKFAGKVPNQWRRLSQRYRAHRTKGRSFQNFRIYAAAGVVPLFASDAKGQSDSGALAPFLHLLHGC